jgi:hypothetical protein
VVDTTTAAEIIVVAEYASNPGEALADAVWFGDIYVCGTTALTDDVSIRIFEGDSNSHIYVWSTDIDSWVPVGEVAVDGPGYSTFGGYLYFTVDAELLDGTAFAVTTPEVTVSLAAPTIVSPVGGTNDAALSPNAFDWMPVAGAEKYEFQLSENPEFVGSMLVDRTGELGHLIVTEYAHPGMLEYSTPYYFRVRAVAGDWVPKIKNGYVIGGAFASESAWASGVFITMDEPVEPESRRR